MFEQIFNSHQVIFYSELGNLRPHKVLVAGVIVTIYREYSIGFYSRTKKAFRRNQLRIGLARLRDALDNRHHHHRSRPIIEMGEPLPSMI